MALVGLAINAVVVAAFFRDDILHHAFEAKAVVQVQIDRVLLKKCLFAATLVVVFWIAGYSFPMVAISIGAFILIIGRVKAENVYQKLDWQLLSVSLCFFVVIHGFQASGAIDLLISRFHHSFEGSFGRQLVAVSGVMLILSNLVSNVPAVLLFRPLVPAFPKQPFYLAGSGMLQYARGQCNTSQLGR